ncbi:HNH endonuclease [compost metagenome]
MPVRPGQHKPASPETQRHEVGNTWGQGRGGRPWRRKRDAVLLRDQYTCQVCDKVTDELEVDHITPLARGGSDDMSNLRAICVPCHKIKTAREGGR